MSGKYYQQHFIGDNNTVFYEIHGRKKLNDNTAIVINGDNAKKQCDKILTLLNNDCEDYDSYFKNQGPLDEVIKNYEGWPRAIYHAEQIMEALALALGNYMQLGSGTITVIPKILAKTKKALEKASGWAK